MVQVWQDTFTDVNGTNLVDHAPEVGAGYTLVTGVAANAKIQSNELQLVTASSNNSLYTLDGLALVELRASVRVKRTGGAPVRCVLLFWQTISTASNVQVWIDTFGGGVIFMIGTSLAGEFFEVDRNFTWNADQWYTVTTVINGRRLRVYLDGKLWLDFTCPWSAGGEIVQLRMDRNASGALQVDDLVIDDIEGEPGMIFVADVPLMIPTEGTEAILEGLRSALCAGCAAGTGVGTPAATTPPLGDLTLCLNTNAVDPTAGLAFGDLALTDDVGGAPVDINAEAAPDYCIDGFEGPAIGTDGFYRLIVDQQIFTAAGGATTPPVITGVALVLDGNRLLAYGPLPAGPANFETGDIVKLSAQMTLRPQTLLE
jgi:hypothetical protein